MEKPSRQNNEYFASKVYDCDQPRGGATMIEVRAILRRGSTATMTLLIIRTDGLSWHK